MFGLTRKPAVFALKDVQALVSFIDTNKEFLRTTTSTAARKEWITRTKATEEITALLDHQDSRISIDDIAAHINVSAEDATTRITELELESAYQPETGWIRMGSVVLPRQELTRLSQTLSQSLSTNGWVRVREWCREQRINAIIFEQIQSQLESGEEGGNTYVGPQKEFLVERRWLEEEEGRLTESIQLLTSPTPLSTLTTNTTNPLTPHLLPPLLRSPRLSNQGTLDGGVWTPTSYTQHKQREAVERFRRDGYISKHLLKGSELRVEETGAMGLATVWVSSAYIANIEALVEGIHSFSSITDLVPELEWEDAQELLTGHVLPRVPPGVVFVGVGKGYVVRREFLGRVEGGCTAFALSEAAKTKPKPLAKKKSAGEGQGLSLQTLKKHSAGMPEFADAEVPAVLREELVRRVWPVAARVFEERVKAVYLDVEVESAPTPTSGSGPKAAMERLRARWTVYANGLKDLKSRSLKASLGRFLCEVSGEEMVKAATDVGDKSELKFDAEAAKKLLEEGDVAGFTSLFSVKENAETVEAAKTEILQNLGTQLSAATDPALVLHLSVLLILARNSKSNGVINASGKFVPKLIKEMDMEKGEERVLCEGLMREVLGKEEKVEGRVEKVRQAVFPTV
ncbi:hypothetical protein SAICODRAFT_9774 [Saitoella complicata NRRL Y-17804]|uniref:uncharacterized protein n=1 Tax=Saitoella complicata (strain BCRC 22490 / CBS 7301 / JCM 7358 / NBRC 10748 / NRRL Y-17804) TaxID=698492 RepID=UPI0008670A5C|nr:uncharacterized protein SAICODRAFT_9774 [Saitoella complicata NRRL Y-17804]ODQ50497.1 hypothetical protein SAICODRAFT_9774 [Saitoella complicata NRRL Y-17804]